VITAWVTDDRSSEAYSRLCRHLDDGRQAYVVCPLIEASETRVARAAEEEAERLRDRRAARLPRRLPARRAAARERADVMARFKARELDVLVATTVIEVGVDVPNATIMIVQEADRFGSRSSTSSAAGSGGARAVVLPARLAREGGALRDGERTARRAWSRRPTASSSRSATSRSAARASSSARAVRATRICASSACGATRSCSSAHATPPARCRTRVCSHDAVDRLLGESDTSASREDRRRLAKGHRIDAPKGVVTRPTATASARRSSRSSAGGGAQVLDLFAGSGAWASRRSRAALRSCVFVERDRQALA
jgi:superfamily II DNA/RNA helicase